MKEINKIVELKTNDERKELILKFKNLYGINYHLSVQIASGDFKGVSRMELLRNDIEKIILELTSLINNRESVVKINDYESDSFLSLLTDSLGQVEVSGQVGGSYEDQYMKFKFQTDQTVIDPLIKDLESILEYDSCSVCQ